MSNLEHYFENLLFDGKDCRGDVNKNELTKEEQEAVEICAQYVIWSIFDGRDEFKNFIKQEFELIKYAHWIYTEDETGHAELQCSECREGVYNKTKYCPNCGARIENEE